MSHVSDQHDRHDRLAVASFAAGDLAGVDRERAASLVATCADCASLHDDLLAIARATAVLPAAVSPRDFRISPEQAARLKPAGWRRFVAAFGAPRFTRQLGVGMATLGIAGLLLSALPPLQMGLGGSAAAPAPAEAQVESSSERAAYGAETDNGASPAPAASSVPVFAGAAPSPSAGYDLSAGSIKTSRPTDGRDSGQGMANYSGSSATNEVAATSQADRLLAATPDEPVATQGVSLVVVASGILLAAGIALLIARRFARSMSAR